MTMPQVLMQAVLYCQRPLKSVIIVFINLIRLVTRLFEHYHSRELSLRELFSSGFYLHSVWIPYSGARTSRLKGIRKSMIRVIRNSFCPESFLNILTSINAQLTGSVCRNHTADYILCNVSRHKLDIYQGIRIFVCSSMDCQYHG